MRRRLANVKWLERARARLRRYHWLVQAAIVIPLCLLGLLLFLLLLYRFVNPPASTLMVWRFLSGQEIRHQWVPLSKISKHLPNAVIMSEDARFCKHWGVDWRAVSHVWGQVEDGGRPRGASTIPMQTAKNLFLWHWRSYVRKVFEVPIAYAISFLWPKRRVMEIYLNIAEWGPGIFGAEAAARYHFKKSAAQLTHREAALLAASLPNPFIRRAGRPGPKTRRLASRVQLRMRRAGPWVGCVK